MIQKTLLRMTVAGLLVGAAGAQVPQRAQIPQSQVVGGVPAVAGVEGVGPGVVTVEPQDANRTREQLHRLMERYPPSARNVFALDPALLTNQSYLAAYPVLAAFLASHPDVIRNPAYYFGQGEQWRPRERSAATEMMHDLMGGLAVFLGLSMAIGIVTWLIRTFMDYRRWSRLTKIQTDVHTKLLDRFSNNEEILAYMQSKPGARFLESTPITLDAGPKAMNAPLSRILWALQGGVVLAALGVGFMIVSGRASGENTEALHGLGTVAMALGAGFVLSAGISYVMSRRLGLITPPRSGEDSSN